MGTWLYGGFIPLAILIAVEVTVRFLRGRGVDRTRERHGRQPEQVRETHLHLREINGLLGNGPPAWARVEGAYWKAPAPPAAGWCGPTAGCPIKTRNEYISRGLRIGHWRTRWLLWNPVLGGFDR